MAKKRQKRIPWEYCECGCKGSEARLGMLYYWMYDDLRGKLYLSTEHQGSNHSQIGTYSSRKDLEGDLRKHTNSRLRAMRAQLQDTERAVRSI